MGKMLLNGVEYVGGRNTGGASALEDLTDVNVSSITDGQILKYDSATSKWVNDDESGGTVTDVQVNGTTVVDDGVAKITSYKEVTLAEYEALPASKLTDGILYAIKDGGQAVNGFPPLIYSDQEREVGVWRDGKPLYQKTWECTLASAISGSTTGEYASLINLPDVSVKKVEAYDSNGASLYPFTGYSSSKGTQLVNFRYLEGYIKLYDVGVPFSAGEVITVTVKYTKNSDTPGSGTWTTQGAIAHHYSIDEHIIGTWIDGKPLYERVFDLGSAVTISSNWTKVINDTNIIPIQCIGIYDTNVVSYPLTADSDNDGLYLKGDDVSINKFILQYTKTTD